MRTISSAATAQLGVGMALAQLVKLYLTTPLCVALCRDSIEWNGDTYIGGKIASVSSIQDQGGTVTGMTFTLGGVRSEDLAIALTEPIQGKVVKVYTCLMDKATQAILDVIPAWAGTLDQMPISLGPKNAAISVTAEHRGITFARPKGLLYTDVDQQKVSAGDRCLQFIVSQSTHQDVWPAAAFFRQ